MNDSQRPETPEEVTMLALLKRAEAAEKALAERGHVLSCYCITEDGREDSRCARKGSPR